MVSKINFCHNACPFDRKHMIQKNTLELLEFHKLLRLISDFAYSDASRQSIANIRPLQDREDIEKRLGLIGEIRKISQQGNRLRLSQFPDISLPLVRIRPEGAVLEARELADFMPVLEIAQEISLQVREEELPLLRGLAEPLTGFPDILKVLKKSINSEGAILDSASSLLAELRAQIRRLESRMRKKLEEIVRDDKISALLQDDFITTRSGRWVIPVRMDAKGMVPGVVHDVSKSGETAFIEPLGIINLANELENLIADQKAEEIRILRNICSIIRKQVEGIEAEFKVLVYLDVLHCIAMLSDLLHMESAAIDDAGGIHLSGARHPLLHLAFQKAGLTQEVIPLDITLGGDNTVMVITGANAGGKTIALKTIGLLMIMALSGMPVPADSSSRFPLIQNLLVDIGDEQSIENNLSTFSAHISNISEILGKTDRKTIVLLDELGTGTDPDEGGALACAVLKDLKKKEALVFATTHLADIKGFVHRTGGMMNASMEFDGKTLTPLYRLRTGEPGQSHALEIAKRYGLSEDLIRDAKEMLGSAKVEFDNLTADLNEKRLQYEQTLNDLNKVKTDADERTVRLEELTAETKDKQKEILARAYQEASDIIADTKRHMRAFLDELKKKGRDDGRTLLKQIESQQEYVAEKIKEYDTSDKGAPPIDAMQIGDTVFIKSLNYDAPVVEINRNTGRIKVLAKNMEVEVPISEVGYMRGKSLPSAGTVRTLQNDETIALEVHLRGLRVDEAMSKLEHFLNHASMADLREVTVVHGIGKGLLSRAVHEHLSEHPLVTSFRSGTIDERGSGVTIVKLK